MLPELYEGELPYVFLDYSLCDSVAAEAFAQELHRRGVRTWHDEGQGYDTLFPEAVATHIENCSAFLLFLSQKGLQYQPMRRLFNCAIHFGRPVIPIYLEEVQLAKGWQLLFHHYGIRDNAIYAGEPDACDRLYETVLSLIH